MLQGVSLPTTTSDTILLKIFPHITSPHEVWIDKNGIVVAITGHEEITETNILKFINGEALNLPIKSDITESSSDPIKLSFGSNKNSQYSYFDGNREKLGGEIHRGIKNGFTNIKIVNLTFQMLYELAYRQDDLKPSQYKYQNMDTKSSFFGDKTENNSFCYEMRLKDTTWNNAYQYMRLDLDRYFNIKSKLKNQPILSYVISRITSSKGIDTLNTNGFTDWYKERDNYIIKYAFWRAVMVYLNRTLSDPLINETGYNLENKIKMLAIPLNWSNLEEVNKKLKNYGLRVSREMSMFWCSRV